ncbi:MAG: recombinase family protein [Clostridium sp.]|uniref:recombinase family protein n=1 Tax=Lachnospiraceae TaxID=186803 RepID=UPI002A814589|nr:recombinase family protein [Hungatella effluvii]MCC8082978.1 recombinase family protein [Clostridium sp.]
MPRTERIVEIIPATWDPADESAREIRKLRVAAYCRVSTELEQQQSSYDIQIEYYTRHIMQNPNWIFVGVFADDGRSATNTFRRDDFNQLMNLCMKGKVDMVIIKSISRFARNTVDCISWVRKLKEKKVAVYFEKENINTLDDSTEMILTILSSQAQEESRAISTTSSGDMQGSLRRANLRGREAMVSGRPPMERCASWRRKPLLFETWPSGFWTETVWRESSTDWKMQG